MHSSSNHSRKTNLNKCSKRERGVSSSGRKETRNLGFTQDSYRTNSTQDREMGGHIGECNNITELAATEVGSQFLLQLNKIKEKLAASAPGKEEERGEGRWRPRRQYYQGRNHEKEIKCHEKLNEAKIEGEPRERGWRLVRKACLITQEY